MIDEQRGDTPCVAVTVNYVIVGIEDSVRQRVVTQELPDARRRSANGGANQQARRYRRVGCPSFGRGYQLEAFRHRGGRLFLGAEPAFVRPLIHTHAIICAIPRHVVDALAIAADIAFDQATRSDRIILLRRGGGSGIGELIAGAGSGLAPAHICSKRASKAWAAADSRNMTRSLSCCLRPEANRLA